MTHHDQRNDRVQAILINTLIALCVGLIATLATSEVAQSLPATKIIIVVHDPGLEQCPVVDIATG
ncbi:hypothetical protein ACRS5S_09115 [Nocardia asiatica]|uniref:hypothetical protein n=1 Tax=Nocardia asiatica TaxID=209252 RepID=UPI003EDE7C6A